MTPFASLLAAARACTLYEADLPLGPRPVLQLHPNVGVLIAGQAPGSKVHDSGVPFGDANGNRLREWLSVTRDVFYDPRQIAILPRGFCLPGSEKSGDLPPRPECAPAWREQLLAKLPHLELTLVIGQYAQAYHFGGASSSVTELVKSWRSHLATHGAPSSPQPKKQHMAAPESIVRSRTDPIASETGIGGSRAMSGVLTIQRTVPSTATRRSRTALPGQAIAEETRMSRRYPMQDNA